LKERRLPVHRMKAGSTVVAFKRELDAWYLGKIGRKRELAAPRVGGARGRINLVGKWEYQFLVIGRLTVWGGVVEIDQAKTEFGVKLGLTGQRQWEEDPGKVLANPIDWYSDWGTICHDGKIRFTYRIKSPEGNVDGYVVGNIGKQQNCRRPDIIKGQFYQLPPHSNPAHGTIELRRMASEEVVGRRRFAGVSKPASLSIKTP
jgi:hypothetical protein